MTARVGSGERDRYWPWLLGACAIVAVVGTCVLWLLTDGSLLESALRSVGYLAFALYGLLRLFGEAEGNEQARKAGATSSNPNADGPEETKRQQTKGRDPSLLGFDDFYDVLAVHEDADEIELRAGLRLRRLQFHPDRNPGREPWAEERFKLVESAFQALCDPVLRAQHDDWRAGNGL